MKRCLILMLLFLSAWAFSQPGQWTWMKGSDTISSPGLIIGTPSYNEPPCRYAFGNWTDTAGNYWIYGGDGRTDLWKFNPTTLNWALINAGNNIPYSGIPNGVYNAQNCPGSIAYGVFCWVTANNHFWLYGGYNPGWASPQSYLWQYDPAINQWACMSYAVPQSRQEGNVAWTDNDGNLWLFGGSDFNNTTFYNDTWKYNVDSAIWTNMSNLNYVYSNSNGNYGPVGIPSVNYVPAARSTNLFWKDDTGNFWLSGGTRGYYLTHPDLQDVWKFNPLTLEWTLMKGSADPDTSILVTAFCDTSETNEEGARYENRAVWKISGDLVVNFGGMAHLLGSRPSDLWCYSMQRNRWIKLDDGPPSGNYGTKGIANITNYPPARMGAGSFIDHDDNLWLFAGALLQSMPNRLNDLWRYRLDPACLADLNCQLSGVSLIANVTQICAGDSVEICTASSDYTSYLWNTGSTSPCIFVNNAGNYYVTVSDVNNCSAVSNHLTINAYSIPPVSISVNGDTLTVYNASTVQWFLNGTAINSANNSTYVIQQPGSYSVAITDSNGCVAHSLPVVSGIDELTNNVSVFIYPNPATNTLHINTNLTGAVQYQIYNALGELLLTNKISAPNFITDISSLARGIYFLKLKTETAEAVRRFVKQ